MPIYDNELPLYDYKPTGIIDKLVLRNNNPFDAWFGDTKLTAKDMGDYYAYSDGSHQWTYPKSKLEDTSNLNAQQRLERDWRKSPAYGFDKVMLGTLGLGAAPFFAMEATPTLVGLANAASDAAMATRAGQAVYQELTSPVSKAALSSVFGGMGMHNFLSDNGYAKTLQEWENLKNNPNFYNAVNFGKSALGDAMDVTMMAPLYKPLTYASKEMWNTGKQGMTFVNSPLTGKWATFGNRQYRINPNSMGATGIPIESRNLNLSASDEVKEIKISPEELYKLLQEQEGYYFLGHGTGRNPGASEAIFKSGLRTKTGDVGDTTIPLSESNLVSWPHLDSEEVVILPGKVENVKYDYPYGRIPTDWFDNNTFNWNDNPGFSGRGLMAQENPHASFTKSTIDGVHGVYTKPEAVLGTYNTKTHTLRINPNSQYKFSFEDTSTAPRITAENAMLDWSPDNWFKNISGRTSYSVEEAEELASFVPEYRQIEKRLWDEGKLTTDINGNVIVKDSEMSPQEYIMRQSKNFQKMNKEHHYVGVKKELRDNFENGSRDPYNRGDSYEVWTDRKSPKNVEEYAFSGFKGKTIDTRIENVKRIISRIENGPDMQLEQLNRMLPSISKEAYDKSVETILKNKKELLDEYKRDLNILLKQQEIDPLNGGKVYDVTYPEDAVETPVINAEGNHWSRIPFKNARRDAPDVVSHYKEEPTNGYTSTNKLVADSERNGYGVTHVNNVMDTGNGTLLNETIIGKATPVKSVLGNTGAFSLEGPNRWKLYRSFLPWLTGTTTAGALYGATQEDNTRAYGGPLIAQANMFDKGGLKTRLTPDGRELFYSIVPSTGEVRWIDFNDSKDFNGVTGYRFYDDAGNKMHYTKWQDANADTQLPTEEEVNALVRQRGYDPNLTRPMWRLHTMQEQGLQSVYPEFALLTGGRGLFNGALTNTYNAAEPYLTKALQTLKPGSSFWNNPMTKGVLYGTAMSEGVNLASNLATNGRYNTFGQHLLGAANQGLDAAGIDWQIPQNAWTEMGADMLNPGWWMDPNKGLTLMSNAGEKVWNTGKQGIEGINSIGKNIADRYLFIKRPNTWTRGIGNGREGIDDLIKTGIVRGNPRGTERTAKDFTKLYNKNRDHFRDIMEDTGIKGIESKYQSRTLSEEEFNAIKKASANYTKQRMVTSNGTFTTKTLSADPLSDYPTYTDYINTIKSDVAKVEQMPSRIASGEIEVDTNLTSTSGIPTGRPILERFGPNSDYIGDGTPLSYWYDDGRNPIKKGYDYAGSNYGVRVNNIDDYTPFMHQLHLHPSFFRSPKLEDPNVEVFQRGPFGLTLKLDKETMKPMWKKDLASLMERFSPKESRNVPKATSLSLNSDERFIKGKGLRNSLDGTEIAPTVDAHGIAKGNELEKLENLLTNGINKDKPFYTSPLAKSKELEGIGFDNGTSSTTAYSDGQFIVVSKPGATLTDGGIDAVLINDADQEYAAQIKSYLQSKYPSVKFMTYEEAPSYYGSTYRPLEELEYSPNNTVEISNNDADLLLPELPEEINIDMEPVTASKITSENTITISDGDNVKAYGGPLSINTPLQEPLQPLNVETLIELGNKYGGGGSKKRVVPTNPFAMSSYTNPLEMLNTEGAKRLAYRIASQDALENRYLGSIVKAVKDELTSTPMSLPKYTGSFGDPKDIDSYLNELNRNGLMLAFYGNKDKQFKEIPQMRGFDYSNFMHKNYPGQTFPIYEGQIVGASQVAIPNEYKSLVEYLADNPQYGYYVPTDDSKEANENLIEDKILPFKAFDDTNTYRRSFRRDENGNAELANQDLIDWGAGYGKKWGTLAGIQGNLMQRVIKSPYFLDQGIPVEYTDDRNKYNGTGWYYTLQGIVDNNKLLEESNDGYSDYTYPLVLPDVEIQGKKHTEGGSLNTLKQWNDLSLKERAEMMKVAIRNGITNLSDIRDKYNEFAMGGDTIYNGGALPEVVVTPTDSASWLFSDSKYKYNSRKPLGDKYTRKIVSEYLSQFDNKSAKEYNAIVSRLADVLDIRSAQFLKNNVKSGKLKGRAHYDANSDTAYVDSMNDIFEEVGHPWQYAKGNNNREEEFIEKNYDPDSDPRGGTRYAYPDTSEGETHTFFTPTLKEWVETGNIGKSSPIVNRKLSKQKIIPKDRMEVVDSAASWDKQAIERRILANPRQLPLHKRIQYSIFDFPLLENKKAFGGNIYSSTKSGNIYDGTKMRTQQMNQQANPKNIYDVLPLLFAKDGVKIKVTSGYRPNAIVQEGGKSTGRRSRHSIWGGAADIVAIDGSNFADVRRVLDDPNSNTSRWLIANGYGYLDETSATGTTKYWHDRNRDHSHYHIGKDYGNRYASLLKSAPAQIQQNGNNYIDIAKDHIRRNESFFAKSYADAPAGKNWRSVGYGFNDSGFWGKYPNGISKYYDARGGITKEEAERELDWMLRTQMIPTLEKVYGNRWSQFNDNQKAAIIDTMYQRPASVLRDSAFYNAIMSNNPNAVDYLGVKSYDRRNADRRNLYTMNAMKTPNGGYSPEQYQMAYNPFMGYQVSNPRAFYGNPEDYQQDYAKLYSQQEVPQPLVDAAFKYSEGEQRKAERQRQMANFRTLLGMTGAFDDDGLLGGVPLLTGGLFGNVGAYGGKLYGDGGEKEKYVIQDNIVPDALFVQRPVYDSAIFVPNVSREDTLKRANHVYKNYSEAKDSPLSKEQEDAYNALRYLKDNVSSIIPAGVSNCTLTATQWINPRNPIKNASSIVNNPSMYGYEPILQEDAIPGDLLIAKTPNKDSYHTMLITGFADNDGEYSLDGNNFRYKKGEPLLTYSRGGHDASFIRTGVPLSVYNANSDGHTENLYYRYKYPNESFLPLVTINGR